MHASLAFVEPALGVLLDRLGRFEGAALVTGDLSAPRPWASTFASNCRPQRIAADLAVTWASSRFR